MDRLRQADAVLAAVAARHADVMVPGRVTSPMDCELTVPVARDVVDACDARAARERAAAGSSLDPAPPSHSAGAPPATDEGSDPIVDAEMLRLSDGSPDIANRRRPA